MPKPIVGRFKGAAVGHVGQLYILRGEGHAVARVVSPGSIHLRLVADIVAQSDVQLVTVVELVVVPMVVELIVAALVPRQRVRGIELQPTGAILSVELQADITAATVHHQLVPDSSRRLDACPADILQQVERLLPVAFKREEPARLGLPVEASRELMRPHGAEPLCRRHPVVGWQFEEGIAYFMNILRHQGVRELGRQVWPQLVFHGQARVDCSKNLVRNGEDRGVQAHVDAPSVAQSQLVFGIEVQLVARHPVARAVGQGVSRLAVGPAVHLGVGLRAVEVIGIVVAEADVVDGRRTEIERRAIADVVDGRFVLVLRVILIADGSVGSQLAFVVDRTQVRAVSCIDGGDVGGHLRCQLVVPVYGGVEVAPAELVVHDVAIRTLLVPVVVGGQRIAPVKETDAHVRAPAEEVGELHVQVVEHVVHLQVFFVVEVVGDGLGGPRQQVEPRTAQAEVERGAEVDTAHFAALYVPSVRFPLDGTVQLHRTVYHSDAVAAVDALPVAVVGANVYHARQATTIAGREAALVEVDVLHHIGIERREESERVVHLVEWCAVYKKEVLVVVAAMNVKAGSHLDAFLHTRHALQLLHDIGRGEQGELGLEVALQQGTLARLRTHERRVEVGRDDYLVKTGILFQHEVGRQVAFQHDVFLSVFKSHVADVQVVRAFGQGQREEAVLVGGGGEPRREVAQGGVDQRFALLVAHIAADGMAFG